MEFVTTAVTTGSPERVFALLEAGDRWSEWAGALVPASRWQVPGSPAGAVGAVRRLGVRPFVSLERITVHDAPRQLSYVVDSRAPFRDYRSTVTLTALADGGTQIDWRSSFEAVVPGTGAVLRWFLRSTVASFATHLARAAAG